VQPPELLLHQQPLLLELHLLRLLLHPLLQPLLQQLRLVVQQRRLLQLQEQQHPILTALRQQMQLRPARQLPQLRPLENPLLRLVRLLHLQVTSQLPALL
jgi:hypothetical protein